jgi:nucleotide-binding universal stress UspA family protein
VIDKEPTMRIRRILVPTDFSPASDAALAQARELAGTLGASIRLVHVFDDQAVTGALVADGQMFLPSEMRGLVMSGVEARLREKLTANVDASLGHDTALLTGPVAGTIVEYAQSHAADLIVMGTHGRSGVAHLLLGSVAERVVRTAPCPVLTVRQHPLAAAVAETSMMAVPLPVQT